MKEIQTTQGYVAIIDDEDFDRVSKIKWCAAIMNKGKSVYIRNGAGKTMKSLHRFICGLEKGDPRVVDHINGNTLDNRKCNLRVCTSIENSWNSRIRKNEVTTYKGMCRSKAGWQASLFKEGKRRFLGIHNHEVLAAIAYNRGAREFFGQFAGLNPIYREQQIQALLDEVDSLKKTIAAKQAEIKTLCDLEIAAHESAKAVA